MSPSGPDVTDAMQIQRERATGAFALWIDDRPTDEAAWKTLRRALGFSRADLEGLRERVPGVVRRGARVDLIPLLERVRAAGHTARIEATEAPSR